MNNLKQILIEALSDNTTFSVNVYRSIADMVGMLDDNLNTQINLIKNKLGNSEQQEELLQLTKDVIERYSGNDQYSSNATLRVIEQMIDSSDVTSIYFDGEDCKQVIESNNISDQSIKLLVDKLVDQCKKFNDEASKVNEKCHNLITIKIKDLLEAEDQLTDTVEALWNDIKYTANAINQKYSIIKRLVASLNNNNL